MTPYLVDTAPAPGARLGFMPEIPSASLEVQPTEPAPSPWQRIAEALKQHPREWRRVTGHPAEGVATTNISRGTLAAFRPAGTYEAVRRDGQLFVRYLGTLDDIAARVGHDGMGAPRS